MCLYTRRGVDRAPDVPDVVDDLQTLPDGTVVDGELTYLGPGGTSTFQPIHTGTETLEKRELTPTLFVFDLLFDGGGVTDLPLLERKEGLEDVVDEGKHLSIAPYRLGDFGGYIRKVTDAGEEGFIIKRRDSRYYPGVRSAQWLKVKRFTKRDAIVVGYTPGEGTRAETFESLVLFDGERCIGRVGIGFTEEELASIADSFEPIEERPVTAEAAGADYIPVEPFVVQVRYQELTREGKFLVPVFVRLRPDKHVDDVRRVDIA